MEMAQESSGVELSWAKTRRRQTSNARACGAYGAAMGSARGLEDVAAAVAPFVGLEGVAALRSASRALQRDLGTEAIEVWLTAAQERRARARAHTARGGDVWQAKVGIGPNLALRGRVVSGLECAAVEQVHADGSVTAIPRSTGALSLARMPEWDRDAPELRASSLELHFASFALQEHFAALWGRFPNLDSVAIRHVRLSQLAPLQVIAPKLRRLRLDNVLAENARSNNITQQTTQWVHELRNLCKLRISCEADASLPANCLSGLARASCLDSVELRKCGPAALGGLAAMEAAKRLRHLIIDLSNSEWTPAVEKIAQLVRLEHLELTGVAAVVDLDVVARPLHQLKVLKLSDLKVSSFGDGFSTLEVLWLWNCELVTPSCMASFRPFVQSSEALLSITLELCGAEGHPRELLMAGPWPRNLHSLHVSLRGLRSAPGSSSVKSFGTKQGTFGKTNELASLRGLSKIQTVQICVPLGSWSLASIPAGMGRGRCESFSLEGIRLPSTTMSDLSRSLLNLRHLHTAVDDGFDANVLSKLQFLERLTLIFQGGSQENDPLEAFPALPQLRHIEIVNYPGQSLRTLECLAPHRSLRSLIVRQAVHLEMPPRLVDFQNLHQLVLLSCPSISSLAWTHRAGKCGLRSVVMRACSGLVAISTPCFSMADSLVLTGCGKLSNFDPVGRAKHCRALDLTGNSNLVSFPRFESGCGLRRVTLRSLVRLIDISGLAACASSLQVLDVKRCVQLRSIEILRSCPRLREVYLNMCNSLHDVSPLEDCLELEIVDLSWCSKVSKLFTMRNHFSMRKLVLPGATQLPLKELAKIRWLPIALEELRIDETPVDGVNLHLDSLAYTVVNS
ncbi:Hypothetical Protein FCC1311_031302 [Hondaea fermentalgiana]|uniref:Uncharacterized protein n=1 Tax=Hondaea fermentalgiana TaxID=2315210 RepID=A0A2R5G778_9STRA|nr:Hypothetical Protein FCC1311_031302 [Hondaea fermentalgiana]|eukprot:GBG26907.1 Hypothetical Protein FCC1311_031302 [Hondaea fermentalgiana]